MPQSKEVHREYMRKRRKGSQDKGSHPQGSQRADTSTTDNVTLASEEADRGTMASPVTKYHPIMYALVNKDKRKKLQAIVDSLGKANLLDKVYYGAAETQGFECTKGSIDFAAVSQLLEATH